MNGLYWIFILVTEKIISDPNSIPAISNIDAKSAPISPWKIPSMMKGIFINNRVAPIKYSDLIKSFLAYIVKRTVLEIINTEIPKDIKIKIKESNYKYKYII